MYKKSKKIKEEVVTKVKEYYFNDSKSSKSENKLSKTVTVSDFKKKFTIVT